MGRVLTSYDINLLLASDERFMCILSDINAIAPQPWCVFGGQLRNIVWDRVSRSPRRHYSSDVDIAIFAPQNPALSESISRSLTNQHPSIDWDVANFAYSHIENHDDAYTDLEEGLASQLMTVASIGATLDDRGKLRLIAPLGTSDLSGCIVRPTPIILAHPERKELIIEVITKKQWLEKWPQIQVKL